MTESHSKLKNKKIFRKINLLIFIIGILLIFNGLIQPFNHDILLFENNFSTNSKNSELENFPDYNLVMSTYLGGFDEEIIYDTQVDYDGNIVIIGKTRSPDFPVLNEISNEYGGAGDIFVTKFSQYGNTIFSTFIGGSNEEYVNEIKIDKENNIIIIGQTKSEDFPLLDAFDTLLESSTPYFPKIDGFIIKLNPKGEIVFSTLLGGNNLDHILFLEINSDNDIFLGGYTRSTDFPTINAFDDTYDGNDLVGDIYIMKLNPQGNIVFSSFIGGYNYENLLEMSLDINENIILRGITDSQNFPLINSLIDNLDNMFMFEEIFLIKIDSNSGEIIFSTIIGGSDEDNFHTLIEDSNGNIILVGNTNSTDFPVFNAFDDNKESLGNEGFISKFDIEGNLIFSTYIGGEGNESIRSMKINKDGNIVIGGMTNSTNFPLENAIDSDYNNGETDAFVMKLNSTGNLEFSTYIGGNNRDILHEVLLEESGDFSIVGETNSINFPSKLPFDNTISENYSELFVTKFNSTGALQYSSFLGGSKTEIISNILLDNENNIIISGKTLSNDFPLYNSINESMFEVTTEEYFLTKIDEFGGIVFSSLIGGNNIDSISEIILDNKSNMLIYGMTRSIDFPVKNSNLKENEGKDDLFVLSLTINGTLQYGRIFGGSQIEQVNDLILHENDHSQNIFFIGLTRSTDFPIKNGFDQTYSNEAQTPYGTSDISLVILNNYPDLDNDGMDDSWEIFNGLNSTINDANLDFDNDGMINLYEFQMGLNPTINDAELDSDGDGMPNLWEYKMGLLAGISDGHLDKDGDGMPNFFEYVYGFFPNNSTDGGLDRDLDKLNNTFEYLLGSNPNKYDTDDDGMPDGFEFEQGFDVLIQDGHLDPDSDFVSNLDEYYGGSDPHNFFSFPLLSINGFYLIIFLIIIILTSVILFLYGINSLIRTIKKILKFKNKIKAPNLIITYYMWNGGFKSYKIYLDAKKKGAKTIEEYNLIINYAAPNFKIATEIYEGQFKDYEHYLHAKTLGARNVQQLEKISQYNAIDYETAYATEEGGFPSYEIYEIARKKGIITFEEYLNSELNSNKELK